MDIDNKNILVTGATGSFGSKMVETLIGNFNPNKIIIYSRDELKQSVMQKSFEEKYGAKLIKEINEAWDRVTLALKNCSAA